VATPQRWLTLLMISATAFVSGVAGQDSLARPRLDPGRDTNSAAAYYFQGLAWLRKHPREAAQAFVWANRLDPAWADPYYARRVALLLTLPDQVLENYLRWLPKVVRSPQILAIDSLQIQAYLRNPLLEDRLWSTAYDELRIRYYGSAGSLGWVSRGDPWFRGMMAEADGRLDVAADAYAESLRQHGELLWVRFDRAKVLFRLGQPDGAEAELTEVLRRMKDRDDGGDGFMYESRDLYEHALAVVHLVRGDTAACIEALGRTLVEDVSRYPAHQLLGRLALARGDSGNALAEFTIAAELAPTDAAVRYELGGALLTFRHFTEALEAFQIAITSDPWYAPPYFSAGYILENMGRFPEATRVYRQYLELAPKAEEAKRNFAQSHLREIESLPGPDTTASQ
jgi:tetratricopeptide (TPR) repeat protein